MDPVNDDNNTNTIPWITLKSLSFDIYGTLVDWQNGLVDAALRTPIAPYLPPDRAQLYDALRRHDEAIEQERPRCLKADVNAEAFRRLARDLGLVDEGTASEADVERSATMYGGAIGTFPAFPDTVHAMQRLGQHYKLIALSNIDHASFSRTLSGPLRDCRFDACYIAEDIGSYKPDLRNFDYLLSHLRSDFGIDRAEDAHVAQSLYHDHAATGQIGLQSVWVDRYGGLERMARQQGRTAEEARAEHGYKLRVESLGELADVVDMAFERG
ncbi:HAD-like protein [Teratosphaeria destructans]|uniref:HAD-like protein n=1 Tax=Teratosphaeria destructans TaxID=418781 RepID=A0A9W7W1H0_9PEZI|nr:HAD-like protein [Teratosphaeria destructans]